MFRAFNEQDFWQEIKEKDYLSLKVDTVSAMLQDPTFARGETDKVLEILKKEVPEIFEEEIHLEYENRLDEEKWDKGYFTELTYWFQNNFALSRIPYIKKVGKKVHADTEAAYNASLNKMRVTTEERINEKNPPQAPEQTKAKKNNKLPIFGVAIAIVVLALIILLLIVKK